MPSIKIYKKGYGKLSEHEVESKIEDLEENLKSRYIQLAFMAGMTPQHSKDISGVEMNPEEYIPHHLEEIFEEIESITTDLYFYRCLLENMKYCEEDVFWDD